MPPLSLRPVSPASLRFLLTGCVMHDDIDDATGDAAGDAADGLEDHE